MIKAEEAMKFVAYERQRRSLRRWRYAALASLALLALVLVGDRRQGDAGSQGPFIGLLSVDGIILEDQERHARLSRFAGEERAKALIVRLNSPGGTVVGGEALYGQLKRIAARKPVAVVMGEVATSAAYMASLGAERVFSHEGTITGSIGVIMQVLQIRNLLKKLGIAIETFKSGEFKAVPNPIEPITPAVREMTQKTIDEIHDIFVQMVADNRGLGRRQVLAIADGRIFSGRQALEAGLVDEIGGQSKAMRWLFTEKGVDEKLPVEDIMPPPPLESFYQQLVGMMGGRRPAGNFTLPANAGALRGLVSLWSPHLLGYE